ncbi:MAG: type II toxin-antitoxin system HicB family antitoxin [Collinsella sp.]|nr:type II toxin-antitoxin system HicB family antitoxin [Collinsella sp.]
MGKHIYQAVLTPGEEGGYDVEVPALPGCYTFGDTYEEAAMAAADAMRTYVASLLLHGDDVPAPSFPPAPAGSEAIAVYFEVDEGYIVRGEVVSAADAARRLGVSRARVTQMLASGALDGYRRGRSTFVSVESVNARIADAPAAGRPRKRARR